METLQTVLIVLNVLLVCWIVYAAVQLLKAYIRSVVWHEIVEVEKIRMETLGKLLDEVEQENKKSVKKKEKV